MHCIIARVSDRGQNRLNCLCGCFALPSVGLGRGLRMIYLRHCANGGVMFGERDAESLAKDDTEAHADDR